MRKLTEDLPQVNLALSLHAPIQEMRERIVPTAKRYPIEGIIDAMDNHMRGGRSLEKSTEEELKAEIGAGRRKAMVEYVMCKYRSQLEHYLIYCNACPSF